MPKLSDARGGQLSAVPDPPADEEQQAFEEPADETPAAKKAAPVKKAAAKKAAPTQAAAPKVLGGTSLLDAGQPLSEMDDFLNLLYYGIEGTWKTSHTATMANLAPDGSKVYIINAEGGLKKGPLRRLGIDVDKIIVLPNREAGQELTFEFLEDLFWEAKARLEEDPNSIFGFGWDSITEIHKKLLENITTEAVTKAANLGRDRDRWFIDRSDWGQMSDQVRLLLRRFRDLPCNFVATALERRDTDDDGKVKYAPAVTPALQTDLLGFVDIVCHTTVEEFADGKDIGVGSFRPVGKYRGKDRFGIVPTRLAVPSFERIHGYVNETLTVKTDEKQNEVIAALRARVAETAAKDAE